MTNSGLGSFEIDPAILLSMKMLELRQKALEATAFRRDPWAEDRERLRQIERHPVMSETGEIMTQKEYDTRHDVHRFQEELGLLRGNFLGSLVFHTTGDVGLGRIGQGAMSVLGNPRGGSREPRPLGLRPPFGSGQRPAADFSTLIHPATSLSQPRPPSFDPQWRFLDEPVWSTGSGEFVLNPYWRLLR